MKYLIIKPEEYQQAINECERLAKENEELKTSLDHAAEVLAKVIFLFEHSHDCVLEDVLTDHEAIEQWEQLTPKELQEERNRAKELLKK